MRELAGENIRQRFVRGVAGLKGQELWGVVCGAGTGSVLAFSAGPVKKRERPLSNACIPERIRLFEGTFDLMVYCAWRVETRDTVIGGSADSNHSEGKLVEAATLIEGRTVAVAEVQYPALDLVLRPEGDDGLTLRLFCDAVGAKDENEDDGHNYTMVACDELFFVRGSGQIESENR